MSCMPDVLVEGAVREVARVYELIKTHQPLFLHHHHPQGQHKPPAMTTQMAQSLLGEALRALNIAISVMNHQQQDIGNGTTASPPAVQPSSPSEPANSKEEPTSTSARSAKRKRPVTEGGNNKNSSWTILTRLPFGDRYEWRKYGEKRINGTHFTKSYFRCTHKDDTGCLGTKYVQQKDSISDPPLFQVTYNNEHTCNFTATSSSPAKKITNNSNPPTTREASASNNRPPPGGHHDAMMIKQEATVVLQTPLADVPLDDHQMLPYQEPFPMIADHYVTMNAGDSSCLLGAFCNEQDTGQIMTEPLIAEDDIELFFLCNGF